jgi:hypothetical protein
MVCSQITNLGKLPSVYSVALSEISSADLMGAHFGLFGNSGEKYIFGIVYLRSLSKRLLIFSVKFSASLIQAHSYFFWNASEKSLVHIRGVKLDNLSEAIQSMLSKRVVSFGVNAKQKVGFEAMLF